MVDNVYNVYPLIDYIPKIVTRNSRLKTQDSRLVAF